MTEIEKMFENAGIKECNRCLLPCPFEDECEGCEYNWYPEFTAEKQIAILKLLTQQRDLIISHFTEWEFIHFDGQEPLQVTGKDFTETFAKLISAYWQSLTDQEKEEIRGILNE